MINTCFKINFLCVQMMYSTLNSRQIFSDISHLRIRLSISFYMKHIVFLMFFHTTNYCSCRWQCHKYKMQLIISVMKYAKFNSDYKKSKKNRLLKNNIKIHRLLHDFGNIHNLFFFFLQRNLSYRKRCHQVSRQKMWI